MFQFVVKDIESEQMRCDQHKKYRRGMMGFEKAFDRI